MLERKSDIVRRLVACGEYRKALKIAKDFRLGISKADSDAMKLGWNCIQSPDFYRQINVNVEAAKTSAIETVCTLYGDRRTK
jgi:hypothetical protein